MTKLWIILNQLQDTVCHNQNPKKNKFVLSTHSKTAFQSPQTVSFSTRQDLAVQLPCLMKGPSRKYAKQQDKNPVSAHSIPKNRKNNVLFYEQEPRLAI